MDDAPCLPAQPAQPAARLSQHAVRLLVVALELPGPEAGPDLRVRMVQCAWCSAACSVCVLSLRAHGARAWAWAWAGLRAKRVHIKARNPSMHARRMSSWWHASNIGLLRAVGPAGMVQGVG